jgi:hypothetical protein
MPQLVVSRFGSDRTDAEPDLWSGSKFGRWAEPDRSSSSAFGETRKLPERVNPEPDHFSAAPSLITPRSIKVLKILAHHIKKPLVPFTALRLP